ncbi:hypothetical protein HYE68_010414 [Fusarium pseudograminearum]|nr:hypothetical protein HYE68_010414 [Fusarium pseudograminearum]
MDTLHEDLFRDIDTEDEADLYDQVPESSCTEPRKTCARCQELGRRCYRCRRNKNTKIDETTPKKSSLELILGPAASRRRYSIEETPPEPTRTTKDTPTRARPQESTQDTRTTYSERTYTSHNVQFEVLKTCAGWQLLSTKCHVEELVNGRRTHYHEHRHLGGPFTDPSRCNTCRWLPTEDITFRNIKVTYIRKAPLHGYAKEVWSAMIGEPLPMRGSVIRSTWYNSGPLRVRRDQIFGPGRLMDRLSGPSDSDLSLEDIVNYLCRVCKSIYYALRHYIFGIYPAGDRSHELD